MYHNLTKTIALLFLLITPTLQLVGAKEVSQSSTDRKITVTVDVKPNILPNDAEQWTLYVYATKPDTRLPLANYKGKLSQLPTTIVLHQSMYLLPHLTLKTVNNVTVIAKATKNKNPHQKSTEDIIGYAKNVSFDTSAHQFVKLTINQYDKVGKPNKNKVN